MSSAIGSDAFEPLSVPMHLGIEWYGEAGQDGALAACGRRAGFMNATTGPVSAVTCEGCIQPCACKGGPARCKRCL